MKRRSELYRVPTPGGAHIVTRDFTKALEWSFKFVYTLSIIESPFFTPLTKLQFPKSASDDYTVKANPPLWTTR